MFISDVVYCSIRIHQVMFGFSVSVFSSGVDLILHPQIGSLSASHPENPPAKRGRKSTVNNTEGLKLQKETALSEWLFLGGERLLMALGSNSALFYEEYIACSVHLMLLGIQNYMSNKHYSILSWCLDPGKMIKE